MTMKNLDGSVYKLQSANPLLRNQNKWDNYVLHNCKWSPKQYETPPPQSGGGVMLHNLQPKLEKTEEPPVVDLDFIKKAMGKESSVLPKVEPKSEIKGNYKNIVIMHCLPVKSTTDKFYGDVRKKYADKFKFEAFIMEISDLHMNFWTNIVIENYSIVFPWKYKDGKLLRENRWWQVVSKVSKSGGFIYSTIISDNQPDFT